MNNQIIQIEEFDEAPDPIENDDMLSDGDNNSADDDTLTDDDMTSLNDEEEDTEQNFEEVRPFEIPEHTAVVNTEQELYTAINSAVITTIHLGSDITMTSNTTENYSINPAKPFLILDGTNPYADQNSAKETIHTLTDHNSASDDRALRLRDSGNLKSIIIQNMDIIGRNNLGIVCTNMPNINMYYENIVYSGPMLTYNPHGSAHYYNCDITIVKNGESAVREVAQCPDITLEGSVLINKPVEDVNEIFWLRSSSDTTASFKIEPGANIEITHNKTVNGGLIYSDQADYPIVIGKGAVLRFHGYHFIAENQIPSRFEVGEGAQVYIDFVTLGNRAGLFTKDLIIGKDSVFHMEAGTSIGIYPLLTIRDGGSLTIDDPLSVILKINSSNAEGYLLRGYGTNPTLTIHCQQLNYWSDSTGGGLTALPAYHWQKAEGQLSVQATLNENGSYTNIETNYDMDTDPKDHSWLNEDSLNSTTLNGRTASIISLGKLDLTAEYTDRPSVSVSGNTRGAADIQARPQTNYEDILWGPVQADSDGNYTIRIDDKPEKGNMLSVLANKDYLYQQVSVITNPLGFKITYDGNNHTSGEPPEDSNRYEADAYAVIQGNNGLLRDGCRFAGWSQDPDTTDNLLQEGDELLMTADITLYAVWETLYTLQYTNNSGSIEAVYFTDPGSPYAASEEVALVSIDEAGFYQPGYYFAGWGLYNDSTPDQAINGLFQMPASDTLLYAIWQEEVTDLSFTKVDDTDYENTLSGAEFLLMKCSHIHDEACMGLVDPDLCTHVHSELAGTSDDNCWDPFLTATSQEDGEIMFKNLTAGDYQLIETASPQGYELPLGQWRILIRMTDANPIQITGTGSINPPGFLMNTQDGSLILPDKKTTRLPLTGSRGMLFIIITGFILIGSGVLLFAVRRNYKGSGTN